MSFLRHTHRAPEDLQSQICELDSVTGDLASNVLDCVLAHCAAPNRAAQARRIRELIAANAWTDVAFAMVELVHSRAVRRLAREDGEWYCSLGSHWFVPDWLDDTIEFSHRALPLAILGALTEALVRPQVAMPPAASVPRSGSDFRDSIPAVSCDNYL